MMRKISGAICAVMGTLLIGAGAASAGSFDCKKATSRIEQMICGDPDISSFDSQIQEAYLGALDRSIHPERVTEDQRAWLKERDACPDRKCMSAAYQRRIAGLSKVSDKPAICPGVSTPDVNACQAVYTQRADRELDRYLAAARRRLAQRALDFPNSPSATAATTALAALDGVQERWLAFRKAECEAVYDSWMDGTIRGAMFENCMQELTKDRTQQVWSTWLTFEDSTPPILPKPTKR